MKFESMNNATRDYLQHAQAEQAHHVESLEQALTAARKILGGIVQSIVS